MNAMILAAGRGTRLGELGRTVPKALVDIGGEPLLARQIAYLKRGGIDRIVINAHHLAEQIEDFVAGHPAAHDIHIQVEPELLGTAGGVCNALPHLGEEAFLVLYGDVIVEEPLAAVVATHRHLDASATLTLYRTREVEGKGTVELIGEDTIGAFSEKAPADTDGDLAYVNAGMYVLERGLLELLPRNVALDFGYDVFPAALEQGQKLAAHILEGPVLDVGTPVMLELARANLGRMLSVSRPGL